MLALVALDIATIAYMPFARDLRQCIILRPPGYQPAPNATRARNVDQFPFDDAVRGWQDFTGEDATLESDGTTFNENAAERVPSGVIDEAEDAQAAML